jgi:hypothetical protein
MTAVLAVPSAFPARIRICSDRSFELDETGTLAVLLPVELDPEIEIDTVAWLPDRPRPWLFERHVATHLGDRALRRAQWYQRPIRLVATPADWLRDPQATTCILDWRANIRAILGDVADIHCWPPDLAKLLDRRLREQVAHRYRISVAK